MEKKGGHVHVYDGYKMGPDQLSRIFQPGKGHVLFRSGTQKISSRMIWPIIISLNAIWGMPYVKIMSMASPALPTPKIHHEVYVRNNERSWILYFWSGECGPYMKQRDTANQNCYEYHCHHKWRGKGFQLQMSWSIWTATQHHKRWHDRILNNKWRSLIHVSTHVTIMMTS